MKILGAIGAILLILFVVSISVTLYLIRAKANGAYIPTNEELINAYKARNGLKTNKDNSLDSEVEENPISQTETITPKNIKKLKRKGI